MHRRIKLTALLAADQQRSMMNALHNGLTYPAAYTPYGHRAFENGAPLLLGFNGELPDPRTGHYHLGNGYRQFNPVLMRFTSPDSESPFEDGGLNAYAYCGGDPVNRVDPTGHGWIGRIFRWIFGLSSDTAKASKARPAANAAATLVSNSATVPPSKSEYSVVVITRGKSPRAKLDLPNLGRASTKKAFPPPQKRVYPVTEQTNPFSERLEEALHSYQTDNYKQLKKNYKYLSTQPGPSRDAYKLDYTLDKITGQMDNIRNEKPKKFWKSFWRFGRSAK